MKAAYVCADRGVPIYGMKGCSLHAQEVMRSLTQKTVEINLFTASTGENSPIDLAAIPVHIISCSPIKERAAREQADEANNQNIINLLKKQGSFDFVYERYSLWSYAGMVYAKQLGIPGILEVNAPLIDEQAKYRGLINRRAAYQVAQRCFEAATLIIAVSDGVADYLQSFPEAQGKIHVVPNGVNPMRFPAPARHLFPAQKTITLGFVGTLKLWHGVDQLIEAFELLYANHKNIRLLIVGDGPESTTLKDHVRIADLDTVVTFTGAVAPNQVPAYLSQMDIGVAPYPNNEKFYFSPIKVYEYMAAGLSVVASRIGQISTLIEHEKTGLLYDPGDTQALVSALERLINDFEWTTRLGWKAREIVLEKHTWDARVEDILEIAGINKALHNQSITGTG